MTTILWSVLAIGVIVGVWHLWGSASSRVEQMRYTVLEHHDGYEVRLYSSRILAQTSVQGSYREALNEGFRIVAGYIFGGNVAKKSIAMTAPVLEREQSQPIAMTAPILADIDGDTHVISFGMPSSYTFETLPEPTDARVKIVEVPEEKMAVLTRSGYASPNDIQAMKEKLLSMLTRDGLQVVGAPIYAGYSAPWTPPWLSRQEVMVLIR